MGGIVGGVGAAFNNATITHVGTATKLILPTDGLWRGAVWSLEPSIVIAAQQQVGPAVSREPVLRRRATTGGICCLGHRLDRRDAPACDLELSLAGSLSRDGAGPVPGSGRALAYPSALARDISSK